MASKSRSPPYLLPEKAQCSNHETVRTSDVTFFYPAPVAVFTRLFAVCIRIFFFLTDKRSRSRTTFHEVPESEIVKELSKYGIHGSMLPVEMGGSVKFDQAEWIAQKRAAEMEEL